MTRVSARYVARVLIHIPPPSTKKLLYNPAMFAE
jgi:hypothetical protein